MKRHWPVSRIRRSVSLSVAWPFSTGFAEYITVEQSRSNKILRAERNIGCKARCTLVLSNDLTNAGAIAYRIMKMKTLLIADGWFTLIAGPALLIFPAAIIAFLGVEASEIAIFFLRLYGAILFANACFMLFSRNTSDLKVLHGFAWGSLIMDALSAGIAVIALIHGVINPMGWIIFASFALFAVGFFFAIQTLDAMRFFFSPASEAEIIELVIRARKDQKKIRVRGSAHSVDKAIYTSKLLPYKPSVKYINLYLDKLNNILNIDFKKKQVEVQAGCHLGLDPFDPAQKSTWENSLLYQLTQLRWALPDLGGITHQTVGGFLMTGSSGGSIRYSVADAIVAFRFIDGNGVLHTADRKKSKELFEALGVSMGLLGIITSVTFQCIDAYDIIGQESCTTTNDCAVDLFGQGSIHRPSLEKFLKQTEYTRIMWWPQKGVEKAVVWQARRMQKKDYTAKTNPPLGAPKSPFKSVPYEELGKYPVVAEMAAGMFYWIVGNLNRLGLIGKFINSHLQRILKFVLNLFNPTDTEKKPPGPQHFWDFYWRGLPMDNQIRDDLLPTEFTELWIPIEKTALVMTKLRDWYASEGLRATGTFCCEIYGAKKNPFWLSPAYGCDVVRIDVFWYARNAGNPVRDYYPQFWKLLSEFNFRPHWGKHLPPASSEQGTAYLKKLYPRWNNFMRLRAKHDPEKIFLSDYWKQQLGL